MLLHQLHLDWSEQNSWFDFQFNWALPSKIDWNTIQLHATNQNRTELVARQIPPGGWAKQTSWFSILFYMNNIATCSLSLPLDPSSNFGNPVGSPYKSFLNLTLYNQRALRNRFATQKCGFGWVGTLGPSWQVEVFRVSHTTSSDAQILSPQLTPPPSASIWYYFSLF